MSLDLGKLEAIELDGSTVYVLESDNKRSIGFLRLNPGGSLSRHNRPVEEWLVQVEGTSVIYLYENDELIEKINLNRGETLKIPANQYHQHTNPSASESLTSWHFDGDISEVINQQRTSAKKINEKPS